MASQLHTPTAPAPRSNLEAARVLIGHLMVACRLEISREEASRQPDVARLESLDRELAALSKELDGLERADEARLADLLHRLSADLEIRRRQLAQRG